jgi:hypothetical protein
MTARRIPGNGSGVGEAMPAADENALRIFSWMFVFSSLLVAGFVAISTRRTGIRRALLVAVAFAVSYAIFWTILRIEL